MQPVSAQGARVEWNTLNQEVIKQYREGNYNQAIVVAKQALKVARKNVGSEHPGVATSLNNLAGLYKSQGHYAQADPLYKRSLAISEKTHGTEHPNVAAILNNFAELYKNQGHYAQAEPLYKRALEIWVKTLRTEHPNVAKNLKNLAELFENKDITHKPKRSTNAHWQSAKKYLVLSIRMWQRV